MLLCYLGLQHFTNHVQDKWNNIDDVFQNIAGKLFLSSDMECPSLDLDCLVAWMRWQCEPCVDAHGAHTGYWLWTCLGLPSCGTTHLHTAGVLFICTVTSYHTIRHQESILIACTEWSRQPTTASATPSLSMSATARLLIQSGVGNSATSWNRGTRTWLQASTVPCWDGIFVFVITKKLLIQDIRMFDYPWVIQIFSHQI